MRGIDVEREEMACCAGPLRLVTPQTRNCLWGPDMGGHFVAGILLRVALPLMARTIFAGGAL